MAMSKLNAFVLWLIEDDTVRVSVALTEAPGVRL